jgi:CrcB protein
VRAALIAVASAVGGLTRYSVGLAVGTRSFPWATLAINLTGSLVLGFILSFASRRGWPENVVLPLAIGFLGAYTTFSTFSYESFSLVRTDRASAAALYVGCSIVGGLLAAWAGYAAGRSLA